MLLLDGKMFNKFNKKFPCDLFQEFIEIYGRKFDKNQLKIDLKLLYRIKELENKEIIDFEKFFKENKDTEFRNVYDMICLFLTFSPTTSSAERSFSSLKYIKSKFRSTQSNDRNNELNFLYINKDYLKLLENDIFFVNKVLSKIN